MLRWFVFECLLPLAPVPIFYFIILLCGINVRTLIPIRDGQICFFCTTTAVVAMRDLSPHASEGQWWLFGPLIPALISLIIYCAAVFTAVRPDSDPTVQSASNKAVSLASIFCVICTIFTIGALRYNYGLFDGQ
jgi:hypothetical protein